VLIVAVIASAFVVAILRGGRLSEMANVQFRYFWLLFVPLLIQLVLYTPLSARLSIDLSAMPSIYIISMLAGAVVAWFNRSLPGFPLLLAGLLSNLLVISLNGGYMPVSAEARIISGMTPLVDSANNVSPMTNASVLWILGDTLPVPHFIPLANVFSIGDVLIAAGGVLFVLTVLGSRRAAQQEALKG
jgi:Family of unknown function (DUF5317)